MAHIYLIRHCESEGNACRRAQAQTDALVTRRGYEQNEVLRRRFAGVPIDALYSSDAFRSIMTLTPIARERHLPINVRISLREVTTGVWEDCAWGNIAKDYPAEQKDITDEKLGTNRVFFLPYLMGERSPHNDPAARGAFLGLRMDTPRAALTQAVLEGVAFAIRDCVEIARAQGVEIAASTLCGGGAKSPLWREILANVLGIPLTLPQTEQGPGYGGAMLAAVACGAYPSVQACADALVHAKSTTEPDPAIVEKYNARYALWHTLYPALKASYAAMEALQ